MISLSPKNKIKIQIIHIIVSIGCRNKPYAHRFFLLVHTPKFLDHLLHPFPPSLKSIMKTPSSSPSLVVIYSQLTVHQILFSQCSLSAYNELSTIIGWRGHLLFSLTIDGWWVPGSNSIASPLPFPSIDN